MSKEIDLEYRPKTYFRPEKLEKFLLAKVKGAVLRKSLQALFDAGLHAEVGTLLTSEGISGNDRKALESFHPMFMGGNYLPDTEEGEVEIGRISIKSTTYDVTCVYARRVEGAIHYRVVDEYEGVTLQAPNEARTDKPMTLGEFVDFFLAAWPLIDVCKGNFETDLEGSLDLFSADSEFYPDFDILCRLRVIDAFPEPEETWPAKPCLPKVLAVSAVKMIGGFHPRARHVHPYLAIVTNCGPGIMAMPTAGSSTVKCWLGTHPYGSQSWKFRMSKRLVAQVKATITDRRGQEPEILIAFMTIVVFAEAIESKWRGGLSAFCSVFPSPRRNSFFRTVTLMSGDDVDAALQAMAKQNLVPGRDLAVGDMIHGEWVACPRISFERRGDGPIPEWVATFDPFYEPNACA